ncbi:MAG: hypothetical protein AAF292_06465 [Pseudomonadota bacterium]
MSVFGKSQGHFRAFIEVFPCGSKTRIKPAVNGIRWSFVYAEDVEGVGPEGASQNDIWPEFLDDAGASLAKDVPLIGEFNAIMHIVSASMVDAHFQRLKEGTEFYCMEGLRKVAKGHVTDLSVN